MNLTTTPTSDKQEREFIPPPPPEAYRLFSIVLGLLSIVILGAVIFALSRATDSVSISVWRTQMYTALSTQAYEDVEVYASQIIRAEPTDAPAYRALLRALVFNGKAVEARARINAFLQASGGVVGHTIDALRDIADAGRPRDALGLATYLIAEVEVGTGFSERSQQNARNSLGRLQDSSLYNAYSARGGLHAGLGDTTAAIADYRAAIAVLPNHFFGYEQLMGYQFSLDDFDGAVATLQQGERYGALSQLFYVRAAQQYFFTGRPTAWVLMLLELSHKYDNITFFGWFLEGCVHRATGNLNAARTAMNTWKAERPNDPKTVDELLAECSNPESSLFMRIDPNFESSPNFYGMDTAT